MKFRSDSLHLQGTSSKRDLLGGYIERWFNKIAETFIFNDLLEDKNYDVVSDYFLYANDSDKNAPDIIGLKLKNGDHVPFAQYKNGTWKIIREMPRIEVKVVRKDQALLGVREPQMIDDYYVFVESDLEEDYLSIIFEKQVFKKRYLRELKNSEEFIDSDDFNQLIPHKKMKKAENIGTMRLIGIYTKDELRRKFTLCKTGTSPYYFSGVTKEFGKKLDDKDFIGELEIKNGLCKYCHGDEVYLPFPVEKIKNNQRIIVSNKGSVYICLEKDAIINGEKVKKGIVKIEFKKFDRSSKWDENIALKTFIESRGKDSTHDLLCLFDKISEAN